MRYYKLVDGQGKAYLGVETDVNLVAVITFLSDFRQLLDIAYMLGKNVDETARIILSNKNFPRHDLRELGSPDAKLRLACPMVPQEVWGAGVTYQISKSERERESSFAAECYARVYHAKRPELFFKATPDRCVGPCEEIGIRGDSSWNVPEPELAFVLYEGQIVGYTIGNDVCSRSIEGENPLYLPQAKIYKRCCALGPCISTPETTPDPYNLRIYCTIIRNNKVVFSGESSTKNMMRTCEELASFLLAHNTISDKCVVVLTGTGIVPPPEFTLFPGDIVRITIETIGTLENSVIEV